MGIVRSRDLQTGGLGISQLLGDVMAGQQWMQGTQWGSGDDPPHTHARAGVMRLDWRDVSPPNGLGDGMPRIGCRLSMKCPRGSGVV